MGRHLPIVLLLGLALGLPAARAQDTARDIPFNEPDPEAPGIGVPFPDPLPGDAPVDGPEPPAAPDPDRPAPAPEDPVPGEALKSEPDPVAPPIDAPAPSGSPETSDPRADPPREAAPPAETGEPNNPPSAAAPNDPDSDAPAEPVLPSEPAPEDPLHAEPTDPSAEPTEVPEPEIVPEDPAAILEDPAHDHPTTGPREDPAADESAAEDAAPAADPAPGAQGAADPSGLSQDPAPEASDALLGYVADALIELQALREAQEQLRGEFDALVPRVDRHEALLRQLCTDEGYDAPDPFCDMQAPGVAETRELAELRDNVDDLTAQLTELQRLIEAQQLADQPAPPPAPDPEGAPQLAEIRPATPVPGSGPFDIRRDGAGRPVFPARRELQPFLDVLPDAALCGAGGDWLQTNVADRIDDAFFVAEGDGIRRCTFVNDGWTAVFTGRLDRAHVIVERDR